MNCLGTHVGKVNQGSLSLPVDQFLLLGLVHVVVASVGGDCVAHFCRVSRFKVRLWGCRKWSEEVSRCSRSWERMGLNVLVDCPSG